MTAPILPGAEPASFAGGPTGVLIIHGFTGTPQPLRGLAEALAADGHTVELPLLPGHGTAVADMVPTRWADWYGAAETALAELAGRVDRVVVAGLSMGGTIAVTLAAEHDVAGAVLVNPQVVLPAPEIAAAIDAMVTDGVELLPVIAGDIALEGPVELAYDATPLAALVSLLEHCRTLPDVLAKVTCPVLVCTSPQDHVVDPASSDVLAAAVSGPVERVPLPASYHVATLDHDAATIVERARAFVRGLAPGPIG